MFLFKPCASEAVIKYRLDIMEDLMQNADLVELFQSVNLLLEKLASMKPITGSRQAAVHQAAYFFQKARLYTEMIIALHDGLSTKQNIRSSGLQSFIEMLAYITNSDVFITMQQDIEHIKCFAHEIRTVGLSIQCQNERITSLIIASTPEDYQPSLIARLLQLIQSLTPLNYQEAVDISQGDTFSLVEEQLLNETLKVVPDYFQAVDTFYKKYQDYPIEHLLPCSSELRFYLIMLSLTKKLTAYGFKFCKPQVLPKDMKYTMLQQVYDLNLALRLVDEGQGAGAVVGNDHGADDTGRVFLLTGPNHGGKTTFIRALGIAQVLFQAGCYVPAERASLSPVDAIFTHFPEKEVLGVKTGRLGEEASRIAKIFAEATEYSLMLFNETFSSTRRSDGYHLSMDVLKAMMKLGCHAVFVTHITELTQDVDLLNTEICDGSLLVNLVADVEFDKKGNQGKRTYIIKRAISPNSIGYARDITAKYGLTFDQLLRLFQARSLIEEETRNDSEC